MPQAKSGTLEERPENRLERDVIEWTEAVFQEAEATLMASPEIKQIQRIIDFLEGRQWSAQARYGRSRPVANRVRRQFVEMANLLTDIQPDIQVSFTDKVDGYSELETLMNRMLVDWAHQQGFEEELQQVAMWGLLCQGPVKVQWNPFLRNGMGDAEFQPIDPMNFMQIGASGKLSEAEVIITRRMVTKHWLVRRYGEVAKGVDSELPNTQNMINVPSRPNSVSSRRWAKMSPLIKNLHGRFNNNSSFTSQESKYPEVTLKEFWFRDDSVWEGSEPIIIGRKECTWSYRVNPGEKKYPRGRVIVTAGGKVLEDSPNPYWHGRFPFAIYRPLRVPWKFEGESAMSPIVAMQSILNRIEGGILDIINATVEPKIVAPKAAFTQGDWDALDPGAPGGKYRYNNNTPQKPEFPAPPQLGNYVMPTHEIIEKEMAMNSGASAINQTLQKKQVPGGNSLEMIFNSRAGNIKLFGRSLTGFLEDAGSLVVATKLQFESAQKRVAMYGGEGLVPHDFTPHYAKFLPAGMQPESFVQKMSLTIRKGSLLSIEREDELQLMIALRQQGEIDHMTFMEFLNNRFGTNMNIQLIQQRLQKEAIQKAQVAALMGPSRKK